MYKQMALAVLLLAPGLGRAQALQEKVLPAQSQLYFRWDGMRAHQQAYRQTVAGQMMQGEMGSFLEKLWEYTSAVIQQATQNDPQLGPWISDATRLVVDIYHNGLVLGIEVQQVQPPSATGILVFPRAAGENSVVLPLMQKLTELGKVEVKDVKVGRRFVHQVQPGPVTLGWWGEGEDAVLYAGTEEAAAYARSIDAGKTGLANHPLYRKVQDFKEFPTASRGFLDLGAAARLAGTISPAVDQLVDELGLKGLGSLTFVSGFDGPAQRTVAELETPGPRKGLLSLGTSKTLRLKDLPALPSDATRISASTMDAGKSYDAFVQIALAGVKIFAPAQEDTVKEGIKTVEALLGVNLKADIFDNLGAVYLSDSAASEGPLGLGSLSAFQVKDGKKLVEALERMTKAAGFVPGLELTWKKRDYKGGEVLELYFKFQEASSLIGSFGLYKGWFLYSQFPQPIKGFILRGNGELPARQPDAKLAKVLTQFPGEYTSISITDPRPTIEGLLSLALFVFNLANSALAQALPGLPPFDISSIPHAQETTQYLFPNVTVATDNGRVVRSESRSSFP